MPPEFEKYATILYESMRSPAVNSENIWDVYQELLVRFEQLDDAVDFIEEYEIYLAMLEAQMKRTLPQLVKTYLEDLKTQPQMAPII